MYMKFKNIHKFILKNKKMIILIFSLIMIFNLLNPIREGKTNKKLSNEEKAAKFKKLNLAHLEKTLKIIEEVKEKNEKNLPGRHLALQPITPEEKQTMLAILNESENILHAAVKTTLFRSENKTWQDWIGRVHRLVIGKEGADIKMILERIKLAKEILRKDGGGNIPIKEEKKEKEEKKGGFF
jgi:hypothetical protein